MQFFRDSPSCLLRLPLDVTISQTFLVFDDLESMRHAFRHDFVACSSVGICLMFVSDVNRVCGFWEEDRRGELPSSSHRGRSSPHDLPLDAVLDRLSEVATVGSHTGEVLLLSFHAVFWKGVTVCSPQGLASQVKLFPSGLLPEEFLLTFLVVSWQQIQHLFIWKLSFFLLTFLKWIFFLFLIK